MLRYLGVSFFLLLSFSLGAQEDCRLIQIKPLKQETVLVCGKKIKVEVARTNEQRALGLMCRESLSQDEGMLFEFEEERQLAFWMKNTKIPLSIAFFSREGKLLNIRDMKPFDERTQHKSQGKALYALEMNKGWFKSLDLKTCSLKALSK